MLNAQQDNFSKARQIALGMADKFMRRASGELDQPFYGARFDGKAMVMWKPADNKYARQARVVKDGIIKLDNGKYTYFFRYVQ